MKNKFNFKLNLSNEAILYIVICVIVFAFVFLMPTIYKFFSDIRSGNLFKGNDTPVVDNDKDDKEEENPKQEENDKTVNLKGDTLLTCMLETSTPEGNLVETYTFYYNDNKLSGLKEEKNYDAIADEYLNYVYSEQNRFANINNLYKNVSGFGYTSTLDSRNLIATFTYDLIKLNLELLKSEDETLSINLNVNVDETIEETQSKYTDLGYSCK